MLLRILLSLLALSITSMAGAATYILQPETQLVGKGKVVRTKASDTLMDIARAHGVGHADIRLANPDVDIWLPGENTPVIIPSSFLLPDALREGIVLNLSEMRLYYFHQRADGESVVTTYPVGIGRSDRRTPTGRGEVTMKLHNPAWYPTDEVLADYARRGKSLPAKVPPGPDNPLGEYALLLSLPGYLIHGTNKPDGVGMLVSQGCIRLYPEHIENLVNLVPKGTPVALVDQPYKAAVVDGQLMIEVHPPVYPEAKRYGARGEQRLIQRISDVLEEQGKELEGRIDWERVTEVFKRADGIPTVVMLATGPQAEASERTLTSAESVPAGGPTFPAE